MQNAGTTNEWTGQMPSLESALADLETRITEAQRSTDALVRILRDVKKAAGCGHLPDLEKALGVISQRSDQVRLACAALPDGWIFDARSHLESGYLAELQREAAAQGLSLTERDGRLYCFPVALRLEPREGTLRIGGRREKRLRPREVVRQLTAMQKRRQRFNAQRFLDALYQAYRRLQGDRKEMAASGPAVPLADIHDLLTLLPGSDYPQEEFGRDLLLLARQPDLRTRDGCAFDFPGSTMTKERVKRISVFDEVGKETTFVAVRFTKGN
jgi:hypothetical protein